MVQLVDLAR
ncbi:hypothetical protein LAD25_02705 [Escherichia coli]|nr:hypothetical protein [Escherichia coli]EIH0677160.1 hypothetical protein [Escherichia coli O148]EIS1689883.1 hypothetical protein [Shigella flexneri]QOD23040.1 hypothetical protein IEC99_12445 [Escherichia coli O18ac:H14]HDQ6465129.1 hypothetical protein [Escherichia coli O18 str. F10018-41]EHJ5854841.1 hypothetical protein [Escherichia coli]